MKPQAQIDAERREFILSKKQLVPNGTCHFCGFSVPKLAHWCSSYCAKQYDAEKAGLLQT